MRRREKWSQTTAFEAVRNALGLGDKSRSAFLPFLEKREPDEGEAAALASVFGWPPVESPSEKTGPPDLAAAIDAQAKAIQNLADELRAWRTRDRAKLEKLGATVGLLAERVLGPQGMPELAEPGAPAATAE